MSTPWQMNLATAAALVAAAAAAACGQKTQAEPLSMAGASSSVQPAPAASVSSGPTSPGATDGASSRPAAGPSASSAPVAMGGDPPTPPGRPPTPVLHVPRTSKPIVPSGQFRIDTWRSAVNTHTLLDADGRGAVPVSEARFLWGQGQLYLRFYAGDLDLQAKAKAHDGEVWKDDAFSLSFFPGGERKLVLMVSVTGVVADGDCPVDAVDLSDPRCSLKWDSGAAVAVDADGTLNHVGDRDEEWNVEVALPLKAIGVPDKPGTVVPFALRRREVAYDGPKAIGFCGSAEEPAKLVLEE